MAKDKHRHMGGGRRLLKKAMGFGATFFKAGPITIPAIQVLGDIIGGKQSINGAPQEFIYLTSGYDINANALDQAQLQRVVLRDVVSEIIGFGLSWANKHV